MCARGFPIDLARRSFNIVVGQIAAFKEQLGCRSSNVGRPSFSRLPWEIWLDTGRLNGRQPNSRGVDLLFVSTETKRFLFSLLILFSYWLSGSMFIISYSVQCCARFVGIKPKRIKYNELFLFFYFQSYLQLPICVSVKIKEVIQIERDNLNDWAQSAVGFYSLCDESTSITPFLLFSMPYFLSFFFFQLLASLLSILLFFDLTSLCCWWVRFVHSDVMGPGVVSFPSCVGISPFNPVVSI